jgi:hypothetical protein
MVEKNRLEYRFTAGCRLRNSPLVKQIFNTGLSFVKKPIVFTKRCDFLLASVFTWGGWDDFKLNLFSSPFYRFGGRKEEVNRKFGFCLSIFLLWKACYSPFQLSYESKLSISSRDFEYLVFHYPSSNGDKFIPSRIPHLRRRKSLISISERTSQSDTFTN